MPWCPKCRNEYVEGKTYCPDCDVELADTLPAAGENGLEELQDYEPCEFTDNFTMQDLVEEPDEALPEPESAKLYKSSEMRYEDARSTGYTFLLVGGAGLAVMIFTFAGVLNLPFHSFSRIAMTGLFLVFLVIGIVSMKNSKKLKEEIPAENALIQKIQDWYREDGCRADCLSAYDEEESEEVRYLQRYEALLKLLREQFPDAEEALLDKLASDFCEEN